jgi:hypothetical protein
MLSLSKARGCQSPLSSLVNIVLQNADYPVASLFLHFQPLLLPCSQRATERERTGPNGLKEGTGAQSAKIPAACASWLASGSFFEASVLLVHFPNFLLTFDPENKQSIPEQGQPNPRRSHSAAIPAVPASWKTSSEGPREALLQLRSLPLSSFQREEIKRTSTHEPNQKDAATHPANFPAAFASWLASRRDPQGARASPLATSCPICRNTDK